MSGAPALGQLMTFLMCLTILPSITPRNVRNEVRRDIILYVLENDKCDLRCHPPEEGYKLCQEALHHFPKLPEYDQQECPNARNAACRDVYGARKCTFVCDPTADEITEAARNRRSAGATIKSLWVSTFPIRRHIPDNEDERQRRRERQQQRDQQREQAQEDRRRLKFQRHSLIMQSRRQQYLQQRYPSMQPASQGQQQQYLGQQQQYLEQQQPHLGPQQQYLGQQQQYLGRQQPYLGQQQQQFGQQQHQPQEPHQQNQMQQQQQFPVINRAGARVKRQERSEILKEKKRNQRQRLQ